MCVRAGKGVTAGGRGFFMQGTELGAIEWSSWHSVIHSSTPHLFHLKIVSSRLLKNDNNTIRGSSSKSQAVRGALQVTFNFKSPQPRKKATRLAPRPDLPLERSWRSRQGPGGMKSSAPLTGQCSLRR